jgi:AraC family transcriptional regulator of adaptative response/methylated-DNA-[protein]-cysteine methyltransferase
MTGSTSVRADDEGYWRAVLTRDERFDGRFVFAVRSTGIYCRPSCPARRPRRPQVLFFPLPEAAERAGFRSCRRCRPRGAGPRQATAAWVARACREIETKLDEPPTLGQLAAELGLSPYHVQRTFKQVVGISPKRYADACRLGSLKAHLKGGPSVTHALYEAGYGSSSRLYEGSRERLGMTPATYRRGGRGMRLAYTIAPSPLGRLLVAATGHGVSAVSLGEQDTALEKALHEEYPAAEIRRDDLGLGRFVRPILEHLRGSRPRLDLPLDIQATAFQRRVWEALRAIPYGDTRSYSAVARAIGRPSAARAVARACASNPVCIVVPCHRVVREGGDLGGYRWGRERKRALLAKERRAPRRMPRPRSFSER